MRRFLGWERLANGQWILLVHAPNETNAWGMMAKIPLPATCPKGLAGERVVLPEGVPPVGDPATV